MNLKLIYGEQVMSSIRKINPVILIGGSGTRLWPLSRSNYPKQFNKFSSEHSLFQQTLLRLNNIQNLGRIYLVVGQSNYFHCLDQLNELGIHNAEIIVEPVGHNTAPAVAVAAHHIQQKENTDENLMLVLPSDHQIKSTEKFAEAVKQAIAVAQDKIILFGVKPTEPSTGYGYIQAEDTNLLPAKVEKFLEKPDFDRAKVLITQSNCYWNSGMFFFSVKTILKEFKLHAPVIDELAKLSLSSGIHQGDACHLNSDAFSKMPTTPIDIAIMEKTDNAFVFPLESNWSDLGDWDAVYKNEIADDYGNVIVGDVISLSTTNSYLNSSKKLLTTIGVDNLVVVSTKDSVLVADKSKVQDVKMLVSQLKSTEYVESTKNTEKVYRPWGSYESLINFGNFQVKHIIVRPGGKLSLQMHYHRSEHWIVVKGIADVVCGDKSFQVRENESTYISKEMIHRLTNTQDIPLHLIEVQVGNYLGEDDIVRFEDVYGRVEDKTKKVDSDLIA